MSIDSNDNSAAIFTPHDHVIFTDLDGVEGVLVDLNSKQYYHLNETASLIWRGLANGTPVAGIAKETAELYDVTLEHARSSVEAAIQNFTAHHLLKKSP